MVGEWSPYDQTGKAEAPPGPRVRPEAQESANKHKGSINLFNDAKHTHVIQPPPSPRCPTGAARQNYEAAKGLVGGLLGGGGPKPPGESHPGPRVNSQSEGIAEQHKGGQTQALLGNYGNNRPSPRSGPRVKGEAEAQAEQGKGGRMNSLMHDPSSMPQSARNAPRVKPDAEANALNNGAGMAKNMGSYGTAPASSRGVPRVTREAEGNAEKGKGGAANALFTQYGKLPQSARPEPRVKDGAGIARLNEGGRITKMINGGGLPNEPVAPPRANSSAGRRNIKNAKGTIANIMAESSKWQVCPKPAPVPKTGLARLIEMDSGIPASPCGAPRVKAEAEGNAIKGQGGAVNKLFTQYGNLPQSARPEPRVKGGSEIANLDRGVRISRMMTDEGTPPEPRAAPRAGTDAGRANLMKGRGHRSNIY